MEKLSAGRESAPNSFHHLKVEALKRILQQKNRDLLEHRYFAMANSDGISRAQLIGIVKQLWCFSSFFERIITLNIATSSSTISAEVLNVARRHVREEIGHPELFYQTLLGCGLSPAEIQQIRPQMFTKALFGYLLATVKYENEYIRNVAILQVMEGIAFHFFSAIQRPVALHDLPKLAFEHHIDADEGHAEAGLQFAAEFSPETTRDAVRIIDDLYRLMPFVLDEWLGNLNTLRITQS